MNGRPRPIEIPRRTGRDRGADESTDRFPGTDRLAAYELAG